MTDALTDTRSGPTDPYFSVTQPQAAPSFVPPSQEPTTSRKDYVRASMAHSLRIMADRVASGEIPFDRATIVFHDSETFAVQVESVHGAPVFRHAAEDASLAALQRAVVRWSLPLE